MLFSVRRLPHSPKCVIFQLRLFGLSTKITRYPYLIKAVQGSSKDPKQQHFPHSPKCVIFQLRLFGLSTKITRYPYLIKAVQGSSKDPKQQHFPHSPKCVIFQLRLFGLSTKITRYPYLIKAVQGSSKDPKQQHFVQQRMRGGNRYGEDSWFISSTPKAEVMGVADGVGGWRKMGIDAGIFAKELMSRCSNNAQRAEFDGRNPRQLLIDSFNQMKLRSGSVQGSSTACLVALRRSDCTLHTANLGDSGFLVLRGGKVLQRSDEQHHGFNTPFQLAMPPKERYTTCHCDEPEKATSTHLALQQGDLVLLATDGLFDNVPESMLVRHLRAVHGETQKEDLQLVANHLVALASDLSQSPNFQSPFSLKARANNVNYGNGGKPDDITLILASVAIHKSQ